MVLSPVSNRDWTDPVWNISTPDPEENILTSLRFKNERGRGCHKVEEPALKKFFVSTTTNIVSKLSEDEGAKIDFSTISSSFELKDVYVTINQCTVSFWPVSSCTASTVLITSVCFFHRLSSGIRARILMISITRRQVRKT